MPDTAREITVADALERGAARLAAAGVARSRHEATALWAMLAGSAPGAVWLGRERPAADDVARRFAAAVERRAAGEPFAYAAGRAGFRGLELRCDARALIPRPETEGLVELVLRWARARGDGGVAADLGTGTGAIALSLAAEGGFDRVIAVERSAAAAALARENVAAACPRVPVEVREGDWLGPLAGLSCRVIVANPPYLTDAEYAALEPAVRAWEPRAALASGPDGLDATRAILAGARAVLARDGLLALEIDERRGDAVRGAARAAGWGDVAIHQDLFGRPRYALVAPPEDA